jgi:hypothetical protein
MFSSKHTHIYKFLKYFQISSYLSVTVYVEDVNDHAPQFINAPYHVTVDELTPTGKCHVTVRTVSILYFGKAEVGFYFPV